jgi:hypothetical protein
MGVAVQEATVRNDRKRHGPLHSLRGAQKQHARPVSQGLVSGLLNPGGPMDAMVAFLLKTTVTPIFVLHCALRWHEAQLAKY